MDWPLCLKPSPARPRDPCELNENAAALLCKRAEGARGRRRGRLAELTALELNSATTPAARGSFAPGKDG